MTLAQRLAANLAADRRRREKEREREEYRRKWGLRQVAMARSRARETLPINPAPRLDAITEAWLTCQRYGVHWPGSQIAGIARVGKANRTKFFNEA